MIEDLLQPGEWDLKLGEKLQLPSEKRLEINKTCGGIEQDF